VNFTLKFKFDLVSFNEINDVVWKLIRPDLTTETTYRRNSRWHKEVYEWNLVCSYNRLYLEKCYSQV
jgi:hypothetical protein